MYGRESIRMTMVEILPFFDFQLNFMEKHNIILGIKEKSHV